MTKELLIELVNKRLFLELILTEMVYFISWLVVLQLGFRILRVKVGLTRLLPGALVGSLNNLFLKPIFPGIASIIITAALLVFFIKVYGKVRLIKTIWAVILTYIVVFIGTIFITGPLCSLNKNINFFFLGTPYGNMVGALIETLFPAVVLFILSIFDIALVPPFGKKLTTIDLVGVYLFGVLFYWIFNSSARLLESLKNNPQQNLPNLVSEWIAASSAVVGYFVVQTIIRKQREYERRTYETEKNELLNKIQKLADLNEQSNDNDCNPRELIDMIGIIVNKLQGVSNLIINQTKPDGNSKSENLVKVHFSPRERKIIELIVQGKSNKEIAAALDRSEGGIKNIITKILDKSGLEDRIQLAVYAVRNNLVNHK